MGEWGCGDGPMVVVRYRKWWVLVKMEMGRKLGAIVGSMIFRVWT